MEKPRKPFIHNFTRQSALTKMGLGAAALVGAAFTAGSMPIVATGLALYGAYNVGKGIIQGAGNLFSNFVDELANNTPDTEVEPGIIGRTVERVTGTRSIATMSDTRMNVKIGRASC